MIICLWGAYFPETTGPLKYQTGMSYSINHTIILIKTYIYGFKYQFFLPFKNARIPKLMKPSQRELIVASMLHIRVLF